MRVFGPLCSEFIRNGLLVVFCAETLFYLFIWQMFFHEVCVQQPIYGVVFVLLSLLLSMVGLMDANMDRESFAVRYEIEFFFPEKWRGWRLRLAVLWLMHVITLMMIWPVVMSMLMLTYDKLIYVFCTWVLVSPVFFLLSYWLWHLMLRIRWQRLVFSIMLLPWFVPYVFTLMAVLSLEAVDLRFLSVYLGSCMVGCAILPQVIDTVKKTTYVYLH